MDFAVFVCLIGGGLLIAGIWRWLNSFHVDKIFVALSLCGLIVLGGGGYCYYRTTHFSPEIWQRLSWERRYPLAKDLYQSKALMGKSKDEVLSLLGPGNFEGSTPDKLVYYMRFVGDRYFFAVHCNEETKLVEKVELYQEIY